MPTYAVLGATGSTGSAVLSILSQKPKNECKIHAFVRSASKLRKQCPELIESDQLTIFEGQLSDTEALAQCLAGTKAAFLCIAAVRNEPYCTIAQDVAKATISACNALRAQNKAIPRLIQLNSSATSAKFSESLPWLAEVILYRGNYWIYTDLSASEALFRSEASWLDVVYIKPGGLIQDKQKGHKLSTERQQTFLGWLDLAAGMVEVADEESDVWNGKEVSVLPTATDVPVEWRVPIWMVYGLVLTYFPWVYGPAKKVGLL